MWINGLVGRMAAGQQAVAQPRFGIVTSIDPERYMVRVRLQPSDVLSGWLPVVTISTGGVSVLALPQIGNHVQLIPAEGSPDGYVACGVTYSDASRPPKAPKAIDGADEVVPAGEFCIRIGATVFRMSAAGFYSRGAWLHEGTFEAKGNIKSRAEIIDKDGSLDGLRDHYSAHRHTGVSTGTGQTGTTTQPDP